MNREVGSETGVVATWRRIAPPADKSQRGRNGQAGHAEQEYADDILLERAHDQSASLAIASSHLRSVRRTLELSCEAPIVPGFVSFNSLFGGAVAT